MGEIQQDGLPLPRRNWAMAVIALGMTMAVLDGAIANVALPTIAGDLHVNPSSSIWVVNAFQKRDDKCFSVSNDHLFTGFFLFG